MIAEISEPRPSVSHKAEKALVLALRLAHAENALRVLTSGQVDAIIDPDGETYLLRPAQESLRKNERHLQAVIDSVADAIAVVNRSGTIVSGNKAFNRVLGYTSAELAGSSLFEFVHEDDLPAAHALFFNVIEGIYENATAQFRCRNENGSYRTIEAAVGKLDDPVSACAVFSCRPLIRPLNGRTELVARKAAAPKSLARDRILATISYQMSAPLLPVLMGLEELQKDERFTLARPILATMLRHLQLQSRLLEELADFTAVSRPEIQLQLETIDAHEAVRFVLDMHGSEINAAQMEIKPDLGALESSVLADSAKLRQVIWNLVKHAIDSSPPGASISIRSSNDLIDRFILEVIDRDAGMVRESLPLGFDPFQPGEDMMQRSGSGLGLGMFIAKGLAEAQQGTLAMTSQSGEQGAASRLTLRLGRLLEEPAELPLFGS